VRRRPYCVILLDEIEKAHADVYNVLLQVFDDGRLTDGKGRVVDFSNTLIIATSNLASDVVMGRRGQVGFHPTSTGSVRDDVMSVLRSHFRPEFINRIDEIIIFQSLDQEQIKQIVRLQLQRVQKIAQGQEIELVFDESLVDHFAKEGYQPEFGARELRRQIRQQLETELAKSMLKGDIKEGNRVVCTFDAKTDKVAFTIEQAAPVLKNGDATAKPASPAKRSKAPKAASDEGKSNQQAAQ